MRTRENGGAAQENAEIGATGDGGGGHSIERSVKNNKKSNRVGRFRDGSRGRGRKVYNI